MNTQALYKTLVTISAVLTGHALLAQPNKFAPLPYTPRGTYGQALVDLEVYKHPELKQLALHTTPAGFPTGADADIQHCNRCIVASNFGRIGSLDIQEDYDVVHSGKELTAVEAKLNPKTPWYSPTSPPKYEVLARLYDSSGQVIGVVYVSFGYKEGDDVGRFTALAHEVADELKQRVPNKDALFKPAA
jgi:hypothetical protein